MDEKTKGIPVSIRQKIGNALKAIIFIGVPALLLVGTAYAIHTAMQSRSAERLQSAIAVAEMCMRETDTIAVLRCMEISGFDFEYRGDEYTVSALTESEATE